MGFFAPPMEKGPKSGVGALAESALVIVAIHGGLDGGTVSETGASETSAPAGTLPETDESANHRVASIADDMGPRGA